MCCPSPCNSTGVTHGVSPNDYDWFTPADLKKVIYAIRARPGWRSAVFVGGQSLIQLPTFEGPYLTIDADFSSQKPKRTSSRARPAPSNITQTPTPLTEFRPARARAVSPSPACQADSGTFAEGV